MCFLDYEHSTITNSVQFYNRETITDAFRYTFLFEISSRFVHGRLLRFRKWTGNCWSSSFYWRKSVLSSVKVPRRYVLGLTKRQRRAPATNEHTGSLDWSSRVTRSRWPGATPLHAFRIISELEKIKASTTYAASANKQIIQNPLPIQMSTDTMPSRMRSRSESERGPEANIRPPMCLYEFVALFIE